jgi:hypothetical protein
LEGATRFLDHNPSQIGLPICLLVKHPAGLEMGRVKTAFSCDWQEVNHAFRSVFSCFYVVHEGQFYCDFEFSLGFTVYS